MKLREYFPEFLIYILEETTMQKTFICACCNRKHPVSKRCTFDGHELCQNCYNTETCLCDRCKNRIWAKDSCGDENHSLCHNCEDHYYRRCTDCGQLVSLDDLHFLPGDAAGVYCSKCYKYRLYKSSI